MRRNKPSQMAITLLQMSKPSAEKILPIMQRINSEARGLEYQLSIISAELHKLDKICLDSRKELKRFKLSQSFSHADTAILTDAKALCATRDPNYAEKIKKTKLKDFYIAGLSALPEQCGFDRIFLEDMLEKSISAQQYDLSLVLRRVITNNPHPMVIKKLLSSGANPLEKGKRSNMNAIDRAYEANLPADLVQLLESAAASRRPSVSLFTPTVDRGGTPPTAAQAGEEKDPTPSNTRSNANLDKLKVELFSACHSGDNQRILELIKKGVTINCNNVNNESPLHIAAKADQADTALLLIEHRADINDQDCHYETPLHVAAYYGNIATVKVLCENRSDIDRLNNFLMTPRYLADRNGHDSTVELLKAYGANASEEMMTYGKWEDYITMTRYKRKEFFTDFIPPGQSGYQPTNQYIKQIQTLVSDKKNKADQDNFEQHTPPSCSLM